MVVAGAVLEWLTLGALVIFAAGTQLWLVAERVWRMWARPDTSEGRHPRGATLRRPVVHGLGLLGLLVGMAAALHVVTTPPAARPHQITMASWKTLARGDRLMSRADVEALLGGPPGIYGPYRSYEVTAVVDEVVCPQLICLHEGRVSWVGDDLMILVQFWPNGDKVFAAELMRVGPRPVPPWGTLRRWLGL